MKDAIEDALAACGRERIFHNETQVSVAIRALFHQPEEPWLVRTGANMDEAGSNAVHDFANVVREEGQRLIEWADRIKKTLAKKGTP